MGEVLAATSGLGITADDVADMVAKGMLAPLAGSSAPAATAPNTAAAVAVQASAPDIDPTQGLSKMELYQQAYPIATRITAQLGLRGFRLNLAVEAAGGYDDLVALLPKIAIAAGDKAASELKRALGK